MVYLVGAGPGDARLITVKGKELLEGADVVIYDRLVGEGVLGYVNAKAELVFVGKSATFHSAPQEDINSIIASRAEAGKKVVRLKGGDPYIFGRGGEEARFLSGRGIPFEVVPGVTAASGMSAYSGIPLTDREYSHAVTLVPGHKTKGREFNDLDWRSLAAIDHTLVFYMALTNIETISSRLINEGMDPATPSAVVCSATTERQVTVSATIAGIAGLAKEKGLKPPGLLVIGRVVELRGALDWFGLSGDKSGEK